MKHKKKDSCRDWAKAKDVQTKDAELRKLLETLPEAPEELPEGVGPHQKRDYRYVRIRAAGAL